MKIADLFKSKQTLEQLSWEMINELKMDLPECWASRFPPIDHKNSEERKRYFLNKRKLKQNEKKAQ